MIGSAAAPDPATDRPRRGRPARLIAAAVVVAGLLAAASVVVAAWWRHPAKPAEPSSATAAATPAPATPATAPPPATAPATISRDDAEAAFAVALNRRRLGLHLKPLAIDPHWVEVGRAWSARMAASGKLSHNPDLAASALPGWQKLGENVGVGGTVAALHQAFLRSPHHYENLTDPAFTQVGIGAVVDHGTIWVTFDFEQERAPSG